MDMVLVSSSTPEKNAAILADDISKCIILNENYRIPENSRAKHYLV